GLLGGAAFGDPCIARRDNSFPRLLPLDPLRVLGHGFGAGELSLPRLCRGTDAIGNIGGFHEGFVAAALIPVESEKCSPAQRSAQTGRGCARSVQPTAARRR